MPHYGVPPSSRWGNRGRGCPGGGGAASLFVLLGFWLLQWGCGEGLTASSLSPPSLSAHRKRVGPSKQALPGLIGADKGCGALNASPAERAGP